MDDADFSGTQRLPDSFYLPIISDSSGDVFSNNKLSHFRVQLESPLYLGESEWECGLAEIMWPPSEKGAKKRKARSDTPGSDVEEAARTSATTTVVQHDASITAPADPVAAESGNDDDDESFRGVPTKTQQKEEKSDNTEGKRSEILQPDASSPSTSTTEKAAPSSLSPAVSRNGEAGRGRRVVRELVGGSRAFIYCDIIRPSLCSDFKGKCIRILSIDLEKRHRVFYPVYFFPIEKRVIDTIYIEVKDKYNEYLNFAPSEHPLVLVLHIKRSTVAQ